MSRSIEEDPDIKAGKIREMFSRIASGYDFLNSVLSLSLHKRWRRYAVSLADSLYKGGRALDVCCGTGDFAFDLARSVGPDGLVDAVDFCDPMLDIAKKKASRFGLYNVIFKNADAVCLPYEDNCFDCVTIGFGLRNITRPDVALREMCRVLASDGVFLCLEASVAKTPLVSALWRVYFCKLSPFIARIFGGDSQAYKYLPASVERFYTREQLCRIMIDAGFTDVKYHDLIFGAACLHIGRKAR